jgi:hypothetical protein
LQHERRRCAEAPPDRNQDDEDDGDEVILSTERFDRLRALTVD